MHKPDLISTLKDLDALSQDQKSYLIDLVNTKKKYGLVWEDKPEDVEELLRQHLPVLSEVPERRILAVAQQSTPAKPAPATPPKNAAQGTLAFTATDESNPATNSTSNKLPSPDREGAGGGPSHGEVEVPDHLLIEGDNLHALTALTFTHEGRVDVIYIDPPYNTGNKDFKYNDRFVDREDAYRHSKWLSFMYMRLLIAKRLLAETGVIFISIDDNEQAQLKLLCDEVFGDNFICNVIWQKIDSPKNSARHFSDDHEYLLCYSKNIDIWKPNFIPRTENMIARYKNPDKDPRGPWLLGDLAARNFYGAGRYSITTPAGRVIDGPPAGSYWRVSEEKFQELILDGRIWFGKKGENRPGIKRFLTEVRQGVIPQTFWSWSEVGSTRNSKQEFSQLMAYKSNDDLFVTPKPVKLIARVIQISTQTDSIVLDFFAGSGTTLHATMQLNAEDGGHRQCILVTNNENNIAKEVCYERNKRVIQGYTNAKGQEVPGLTNNNLRYYRCETVPRQTTLPAKRLLMQRATELLCIKEGLYDEVPDLSMGEQIRGYGSGSNYLLIIYDGLCIDEAVALIRQAVETEAYAHFRVYVFSNGQYPYTEEFEEVLSFITLCALPDALYKAYRQVLPAEQRPPRTNDDEAAEVPDLFSQAGN